MACSGPEPTGPGPRGSGSGDGGLLVRQGGCRRGRAAERADPPAAFSPAPSMSPESGRCGWNARSHQPRRMTASPRGRCAAHRRQEQLRLPARTDDGAPSGVGPEIAGADQVAWPSTPSVGDRSRERPVLVAPWLTAAGHGPWRDGAPGARDVPALRSCPGVGSGCGWAKGHAKRGQRSIVTIQGDRWCEVLAQEGPQRQCISQNWCRAPTSREQAHAEDLASVGRHVGSRHAADVEARSSSPGCSAADRAGPAEGLAAAKVVGRDHAGGAPWWWRGIHMGARGSDGDAEAGCGRAGSGATAAVHPVWAPAGARGGDRAAVDEHASARPGAQRSGVELGSAPAASARASPPTASGRARSTIWSPMATPPDAAAAEHAEGLDGEVGAWPVGRREPAGGRRDRGCECPFCVSGADHGGGHQASGHGARPAGHPAPGSSASAADEEARPTTPGSSRWQ